MRGANYTYDGDPEAFLLSVEAQRIRIAYQFDPLFAVNASVVDALPHQVEAVYRYLLPLPRIRFLLADDTGAGKTIMAGLLIRELLFRGVIHKVLIITPGGLTRQWQDEMSEKFSLPLFIQRFFQNAYPAAGGTVIEDRHFPVFHIGRTPSLVLDAARQLRLPVAEKYDTPFVFDKNLVSVASPVRVPEQTKLLGPGHPLFDALIEWAMRRARNAFTKGAVVIDPNLTEPQRIWLVRSSIFDGRREEKKRIAKGGRSPVALF